MLSTKHFGRHQGPGQGPGAARAYELLVLSSCYTSNLSSLRTKCPISQGSELRLVDHSKFMESAVGGRHARCNVTTQSVCFAAGDQTC